jgi:hypothetical protein
MGRQTSRGTRRSGPPQAFRPGLAGCLLWILILLAVLLVLALFFGGFRKGIKDGSLPRPVSSSGPGVTALSPLHF